MGEPLIERSLLEDLGFERCKNEAGWCHEVWYHRVDFWVHFIVEPKREMYYHEAHEANAFVDTRKVFLQRFLYALEEHFIESAHVHYTRILDYVPTK